MKEHTSLVCLMIEMVHLRNHCLPTLYVLILFPLNFQSELLLYLVLLHGLKQFLFPETGEGAQIFLVLRLIFE